MIGGGLGAIALLYLVLFLRHLYRYFTERDYRYTFDEQMRQQEMLDK